MGSSKNDMSCARVQTYTTTKIGAAERHNERKNKDYGNVNVDPDRIYMNVHFKDPGNKSYMDILREREESGAAVRRGLRSDAKIFDELIFDINTMYFEDRGGYEYAKRFYAEAYNFACEKYGGEDRIVSAVMHADEINLAASEEKNRDIYHYHLHVIAIPVVEKEILYTKRCKDPNLVGKVKEVINQISHSKKWESRIPVLDQDGRPVCRKNGKQMFVPSYSILQDEFYNYMVEHGFRGFERGERGSTAEHLTSLQYQIGKDKERLADINTEIEKAKLRYEPAKSVYLNYINIDNMGKKTLSKKYQLSESEFKDLKALAKEGVTSREKIEQQKKSEDYIYDKFAEMRTRYLIIKEEYDKLLEICQPFLYAVEHFPTLVNKFIQNIRDLISRGIKREKPKEKEIPHRSRDDYEL